MSENFYTIQRGDTLSKIASKHGTSVHDLCKINAIENPNRISVGQRIALKQVAVCKVTFQFLDRDRNPLTNAKVRLGYCGKELEFDTGINGRLPDILTESPSDMVTIWIARANGEWKEIKQVASDWGNKLVTLISPKVRLEARTQSHPKDESGRPVRDLNTKKKLAKLATIPTTTQAKGKIRSAYGEEKGIKTEEQRTTQGLPVTKVTNDQVKLEFLGKYTGEKITDEDYQKAASEIGCEAAVIKAVAEVETRKAPFDSQNRPTILYERHVFARNTKPKGKYDDANPDISGHKRPYKAPNKENKKLVKDGEIKSYDLYGNSYPRLSKAYSLDKDAALKACSWGKFQILGENYRAVGFSSVLEFTKAMGVSEREHLKAFTKFVMVDQRLKVAACSKDWTTFARIYNGPGYKIYDYDTKMELAYKKYAGS